jgi:hypothetical protein
MTRCIGFAGAGFLTWEDRGRAEAIIAGVNESIVAAVKVIGAIPLYRGVLRVLAGESTFGFLAIRLIPLRRCHGEFGFGRLGVRLRLVLR